MNTEHLLQQLFPAQLALDFEDALHIDGILTLTLSSSGSTSTCPTCDQDSFRIHSHYERTLKDLPCLGQRVILRLGVRRFRCDTLHCPKRTFAERFCALVEPYSRVTSRLRNILERVVLVVGGEPGARLLRHLAVTTSPDRLLRAAHALEVPATVCPTALGIDDFAFCRGRNYGTVIVDLATGRAVDLLADRQTDTVAAWLQAHANISVVARDRSREYASGVSKGAPQAKQVLDRWHVLKNLREAIEHDLANKQPDIAKLFAPSQDDLAPVGRYGKECDAQASSLARRQAKHQQIHALHKQDLHPSDICVATKTSLSTVYRILRREHPPVLTRLPKQPSALDPFEPYLRQRWEKDCTIAEQLFQEVRLQGYPGSVGPVRAWARQRRHLPLEVGAQQHKQVRTSPKALSWLLFFETAKLKETEKEVVQKLTTTFHEFAQLRNLTASFKKALLGGDVDRLRSWRTEVSESTLPHLKKFAHRLGHEWAELEAACETSWSNRPTEGVVNRIKVIKRQMFGRGSFELLRKRVLLAV